MTLTEWLDRLPTMVGERNLALLPIVRAALREGIDRESIVDLLHDNSGEPPLSRAEILRAVNRAEATANDGRSANWTRLERAAKDREDLRAVTYSAEDKGIVPSLILTGRKWMDEHWDKKGNVFSHFSNIFASPPAPLDPLDIQAYQARVFCGALWDTWEDSTEDGYVFLTNDNYAPRTRDHLIRPRDLVLAINDWVEFARHHGLRSFAPIGECIPQFVCPNLYTGERGLTEDGNPSFVCKATLAHRRVALLEFDHLDPKEQVDFWVGFLLENPDSIYSLTYSGRRSIHGLVNVGEAKDEAAWRCIWKELKRMYSSHDDKAYCCDEACKDATRLTRMPGAVRIGGAADGEIQELLYVNPNAYNND